MLNSQTASNLSRFVICNLISFRNCKMPGCSISQSRSLPKYWILIDFRVSPRWWTNWKRCCGNTSIFLHRIFVRSGKCSPWVNSVSKSVPHTSGCGSSSIHNAKAPTMCSPRSSDQDLWGKRRRIAIAQCGPRCLGRGQTQSKADCR